MITFFVFNTWTVVTRTVGNTDEIIVIWENIVQHVVPVVVIDTHGLYRTVKSPARFHESLQIVKKTIKTAMSRPGEKSLGKLKLEKTASLITHIFHEVPVKYVVVGEALSVEEVPDELPEVGVVRLLLEPQRPHVVMIGGELS